MDTTQTLRDAGTLAYPSLSRGYIQKLEPGETPLVAVVLPEGSSEHIYGPCRIASLWGAAVPVVGAECVVGFDERNQPTVLWWDGVFDGVSEAEFTTLNEAIGELFTKIAPTAWESPESFSAKLSETTTLQARLDPGRETVRLKGLAKTNAEITVGGTILTLKAAHRPSVQINEPFGMITATPANLMVLEPTGVMTARIAIPTTTFIVFDGVTFPKT